MSAPLFFFFAAEWFSFSLELSSIPLSNLIPVFPLFVWFLILSSPVGLALAIFVSLHLTLTSMALSVFFEATFNFFTLDPVAGVSTTMVLLLLI